MKCTSCGWKNPETVNFCRKCGALLVGSPETAQSSFPALATSAGMNAGSVARTRRRSGRRILWIVLICLLIVGGGITWWLVSAPQSTAAITQTLQTYCNALRSGDYQQAYSEWASSTQMSESDFAYVQKNKGKITSCEITSISSGSSSAQANLTLSYASGSAIADQINLVLEQGQWKIKGQSAS